MRSYQFGFRGLHACNPADISLHYLTHFQAHLSMGPAICCQQYSTAIARVLTAASFEWATMDSHRRQ
jgi:hypothetical protein